MCFDEKVSVGLMRALEAIRAELARRGEASMGDLEQAFIEHDLDQSGTVSYVVSVSSELMQSVYYFGSPLREGAGWGQMVFQGGHDHLGIIPRGGIGNN